MNRKEYRHLESLEKQRNKNFGACGCWIILLIILIIILWLGK